MKFILGQKSEMTRIFTAEGDAVPVTVIKAAPCSVIRVKTQADQDGYNATVVGMPGKKKLGKRALGQTKGFGNLQYIKEFRADEPTNFKPGDLIKVDGFSIGEKVKITGFSKGKGFQGVVKRHHFHGHDSTHGTKDQVRTSGSIGPCEPARVFPGVRMPGHMGAKKISVKNLTIVQIDKEKNLLFVKGAVPGAKNGLLMITCPGELNVEKPSVNVTESTRQPIAEEVAVNA